MTILKITDSHLNTCPTRMMSAFAHEHRQLVTIATLNRSSGQEVPPSTILNLSHLDNCIRRKLYRCFCSSSLGPHFYRYCIVDYMEPPRRSVCLVRWSRDNRIE